ncbi:hypothetical protein P153DRAFT_367217 [Dothidotthia symphoricarpi CBS 119687]|uniref:Uncharacterized protein n=1 Tax=Dothidotthia symphoricarpi CBS 119687 TaxID=1392245 RepID=A0A6A6ABF4_9PLEO|nr:uncharacterized protein P153DRAFT_367217 [Dothidotthia symphoricarpi CBS 119687]KAF2128906.1 hypothetical protein P153DRAFT_367217 [Dothidotthia symphoricarpi CBS 119687]
MVMQRTCIVPVEPASGHGVLVLLEVQHDDAPPLDIRIVGCHCEDDSPDVYKTTLQHDNLAKLKHKFKGSSDEWISILSHFLLQKELEPNSAILVGVRMVYTARNGNLELSIRQDVQAIKVTLGEIVLPRDDDFEFDPFEWAKTATRAHYNALQEIADMKARASSEQDTIAKLNAQLEDFLKTKNESETAMLQQFMELLNEKKRKIRDQSRLLAGAKVDKVTASAVQSARTATKPPKRKAVASRTSKRKAPARAPKPEPDSDSDRMEVDEANGEEQDDDDVARPGTPDRNSDNETDAEDEVDPVPQVEDRSSEPLASSSAQPSKEKESSGPPPPRALPFSKNKLPTRGKVPEKTPSSPAGDDDEETDDEEL